MDEGVTLNKRLEAFRNQLRGGASAAKQSMSFKDWWTVILSTLAFLISAASFYSNVLRQTDDVRVILETLPEIRFESNQLTSKGKTRIAFINAGNQSVAILRTFVTVWQKERPSLIGTPSCEGRRPILDKDEIETDLEPFVVKPGEVIIRDMKLKSPSSEPFNPGMVWPSPNRFYYHLVDTCLEFSFATPLKSNGFKTIGVGRRFMQGDPANVNRSDDGRSSPYVLRQESSSIFESWWRVITNAPRSE